MGKALSPDKGPAPRLSPKSIHYLSSGVIDGTGTGDWNSAGPNAWSDRSF